MKVVAVQFMVVASSVLFLSVQGLAAPVEKQVVVEPTTVTGEVKLSEKDMLSKSSVTLEAARKTMTRLFGNLEDARKDKDIQKLNCVNEKLTTAKVLMSFLEKADLALQQAVATKSRANAEREFEKVMVASQKLDAVKTEAEACLGKGIIVTGGEEGEGAAAKTGGKATAMEVTEPKDLITPETKGVGGGTPSIDMPPPPPDRPPRASPFQ
jgi:hypothetical protein